MRLIFKLLFLVTAGLARIILTRAKTVVFLFCFICARFAWPNPPTEEGPSPKRLVHLNKLAFQIILALYTIFLQRHASHEFFAQSY